MMISRRRTLGLMLGAAAVPLVAACGEEAKEPASVTLMLDWVPNTNHTGIYVARDFGFYDDENLEVSIVEPGVSGVAQAVAGGAAEFGISFQEEVTLARSEDVPLVSVAAIIQHNTSGFASPADRRIRRPRDFAGKKYGAFGWGPERQVLTALMQCDGGDFNQIEFVDIGAIDYFVAWERGDVDFVWIFEAWDGIRAQLQGFELDYIRLTDLDCIPDYYTPVLATSAGAGIGVRAPGRRAGRVAERLRNGRHRGAGHGGRGSFRGRAGVSRHASRRVGAPGGGAVRGAEDRRRAVSRGLHRFECRIDSRDEGVDHRHRGGRPLRRR